MKNRIVLLGLLLLAATTLVWAQEPVNEELNTIIRKHGLEEGKVMEHAGWMTDVYGPRLTGSPMLDKATDWAVKTLKGWGMKNVHLESWGPFGRGWEMSHFEMHHSGPSYWPIIAYPKAWSPSVKGSGEVIFLDAKTVEDLEKYRGKLSGKFVLLDTIREVQEPFDPLARRHDAESLLRLANAPEPTPRPRRNYSNLSQRFEYRRALWEMLDEEGPLAILDRSYKGDLGTVFVSGARASGGSARDEGQKVVPQFTVSVEHYNRILRNLMRGIPVELSVELAARYTNPDGMEHNIIAEIPGTDLKDEVVMFGAHFDSWHTGTGATDNAAGSTVMMEAARILLETIKESGVKPRRTLRLALWTGEEQGLFGSRGYAAEHFADFGDNGYTPQGGMKPEQKKISAYYNLDNGTGKIRGVYLQGNEGVAPIFRAWLQPFSDLDATTVSLSNTGGTDHLAFDAVNIPGFQFIQEPMAYFARTHHSNMDNFDHLVEEDLAQAATIISSFIMHTAMRDEMLPRKPLKEEAKEGDSRDK
jgi:carboxypeptidase Q